jgi:hypothetical protein
MNDEWREQYKKEKAETNAYVKALLEKGNFLDDDGYPTKDACEIVSKWHWDDAKGWFKFIESIWHLKSWGWKEGEAIDEITNKKTWCYYISTAGWSGNETLINAMQENDWMWNLNWVQSRRGGHYIFELRNFEDDE